MLQRLLTFFVLLLLPYWGSAFLWEDLGLDLYNQIDTKIDDLLEKQYEYELQGQWEADIGEIVDSILLERGIDCDIRSSSDIEIILGNNEEEQIPFIFERCVSDDFASVVLIEEVVNQIGYVKNIYADRAREKTQRLYELARIGIYHDGVEENSPFDLMSDLEAIDSVLFSEDINYEEYPADQNSDNALDLFLSEDKSYLQELSDDISETLTPDDLTLNVDISLEDDEVDLISPEDARNTLLSFNTIPEHQYICAPEDATHGLSSKNLENILSRVERSSSFLNTRNSYRNNLSQNSSNWNQLQVYSPEQVTNRTASYSWVSDEFGCDGIFCITVDYWSSNYGSVGSNESSLQSILSKVAEHLEKPANASLTQRKMSTNNFEISSIITNLGARPSGFGIQVESRPVPILDIDNEGKTKDSSFAPRNLLRAYYKNLGLDYSRQNDLSAFENTAYITKVLQSSAWLPITYPETRLNELQVFQEALAENNRILSESLNAQILLDSSNDFINQFAELERFVTSIEDFSISIVSLLGKMKEIPSRSS